MGRLTQQKQRARLNLSILHLIFLETECFFMRQPTTEMNSTALVRTTMTSKVKAVYMVHKATVCTQAKFPVVLESKTLEC